MMTCFGKLREGVRAMERSRLFVICIPPVGLVGSAVLSVPSQSRGLGPSRSVRGLHAVKIDHYQISAPYGLPTAGGMQHHIISKRPRIPNTWPNRNTFPYSSF